MKKILFLLLFFVLFKSSFSQYFTEKPFGNYIISPSIGDIDGDHDIDLFSIIRIPSNPMECNIYKNNIGNFTKEYQFPFMFASSVFGNFNNDLNFELLFSNGQIYKKENSIWTLEYSLKFTNLSLINLFDYNLDNSPDIYFQEISSYIFNYQDKTSLLIPELSSNTYIKANSCDFNNDAKSDFLLIGKPQLCSDCPVDSFQLYLAIDKNINFSLEKIINNQDIRNFDIRDYNNDYQFDILLADENGISILKNNFGHFSIAKHYTIQNVNAVKWINCDFDNELEILYSTSDGTSYLSYIINQENTPVLIGKGAKDFFVVDIDNDGDTDVLSAGGTISNRLYGFLINNYKTESSEQNIKPSAPQNLSVTQVADTTYFHWNASTDDTTPQQSLSYNLYIGTQPNTTNIMSPLSNLATGKRKIVQIGNVDANLGWKIIGLSSGTYYWSVQAVDNAYAGSEFAVEQSYTISNGIEVNNFCFGELTTFSANFTNIQSALWHFDDSQTSTELNPTHIYTNTGTYTVTLTVTYTDNSTKTISKEIEIFEKPLMPIIQHK